MKLLEKVLYTTGGLLAAGVLAFNVACSPGAAPIPTPIPTRAIELQRQRVQGTPTIISTPVPIPTPTPSLPTRGTLFKSKDPDCDTAVTLNYFSRSPNPKRDGWDTVHGNLRYHPMPECNVFHRAIKGTVNGFELARGIDLTFFLLWEGGGKAELYVPQQYINDAPPFAILNVPFDIGVPSVAGQLSLKPSIVAASWANQNDYQSIKGSVPDNLSLETADDTLYGSWIYKRIQPFFMENIVNEAYVKKFFPNYADIQVQKPVYSDKEATLKITVGNRSFTTDLNVAGNFNPIGALDSIGNSISGRSSLPNRIPLRSSKTTLAPGLTTDVVLEIDLSQELISKVVEIR
jgi:hypothetical protein